MRKKCPKHPENFLKYSLMYNLYFLNKIEHNGIFLRYFTHFVTSKRCLDKYQFSYYLRLYCISYVEENISVMTGISFPIP